MPHKSTPAAEIDQQHGPQSIDISRRRRDIEPKVSSVRARIYGRFLNGASLKSLADSTGCAQAFVVAVIRSEARAERDSLRVEIARLSRVAA